MSSRARSRLNIEPPASPSTLSAATDYRGITLDGANLSAKSLRGRSFARSILRKVNFTDCDLSECDFTDADLTGSNLRGCNLDKCLFSDANLTECNLFRATLHFAKIINCNFFRANLRETEWAQTVVAATDLGTCTGLDSIKHSQPSSVSFDCLYGAVSEFPPEFLKGVGYPSILLDYLPSLLQAQRGIEFHSCFISYSHADEVFARKLWATLRSRDIRVWYAPEDLRGGNKILEQIESAIRIHDKLLLVLSEASISSNWVEAEIQRARAHEINDGKRKLFPIRLCDMEHLKKWRCFDTDTGRDLAKEVREYFIPDFSKWQTFEQFGQGCDRLCQDLINSGVRMTWRPDQRGEAAFVRR